MKLKIGFLLALVLVLSTLPTFAQNVVNPRIVEFTASVDHNKTTSTGAFMVEQYEIRFYASGATQPMFSGSLGKPMPDTAGKCSVNMSALIIGLPYGNGYTARVVAIGPSGQGVSNPSNPFDTNGDDNPPTAPTNIVLKR